MNRPVSPGIILLGVLLFLSLLFPFRSGSFAEFSDGLTLVLKAGTADDWELHSPGGVVRGTMMNRNGETFKLYDSRGNYNGFVYQSGDWVPRDARQKRELLVSPEDVGLYIDMITAAELNVPEPRELQTERKQGAENEWVLRDPNGDSAGTVAKEEVNLKFYDESGKFMGYIDTSGNWLPRLGINRREMRITPEQARFFLDVLNVVAGLK